MTGGSRYKLLGGLSHIISSSDTPNANFDLGSVTITKGTWILITYVAFGFSDENEVCYNSLVKPSGNGVLAISRTSALSGGGCYSTGIYRNTEDNLIVHLRSFITQNMITKWSGKSIYGTIQAYKLSDNI